MGWVLQGNARTTAAFRRAIRHVEASPKELALRFAVNPKTVAN